MVANTVAVGHFLCISFLLMLFMLPHVNFKELALLLILDTVLSFLESESFAPNL